MTQSTRAGIIFPVGRIGRYMRTKGMTQRVGKHAPIYMAAVMEYICAEVIEVAGQVCNDMRASSVARRHMRLIPRHVELAVRDDTDLARFFHNKTFFGAGTTPYINPGVEGHGIAKKGKKTDTTA